MFIFLSTALLSQTTGKTKSTTTRKFYPPAGAYMAPSTVTDSTIESLFLMKEGTAYMANNPMPMADDPSLIDGTYKYDDQKHAVQFHWKSGSKTQWIPIQKDSSINLKGLNFRLMITADSSEVKNRRNRIAAGLEE